MLLCLIFIGAVPDGQAEAGPVLTIALPVEPPNLDPTTGASAAVDEVVLGNVMEGLTRIAEDGRVLPLLATGWQVGDDGRHYDFMLRDDVRFQDGSPFTADDVKFSLDRARAPGSANAQRALLSVIDDVQIIDHAHVRLILSRPAPDLPFLLGWGDAVMVQAATAGQLATAPVGTGPFRVAAWRRGDRIVLERNPGYWGTPAPAERVTIKFLNDPSAALAALQAGDLDGFSNYPAPESVAPFAADDRFRVALGQSQGKIILALNNAAGPFADIRVRRAASHAIDRAAIIAGAMFGHGLPIGSHYARTAPGWIDLADYYPHDLQAARALLTQAGFTGKGPAIALRLPARTYARRIGEMVAAQMQAAGFDVTIEILEWPQWLDQIFKRHVFDMTIVEHVEPMDYDIYGRDDYYFGYGSPAMKTLLDRLNQTAGPAQRLDLLADIQRRIAEDAVVVPLLQSPRIGIWKQQIQGVWTDAPLAGTPLYAAFSTAWTATAALPASASAVATADATGRVGWVVPPLLLAILVLAASRFGGAYLLGRGLVLLGTLLAASMVIFLLLQVVPGDPAAFMMGMNADPAAIAALRLEMGLDAGAVARYLRWVAGLVQGEFGISYTYRTDVGRLILERLAVSGPLALFASLLSLAVALPVGLLAATRRDTLIDRAVTALTQLGIALPNFWLAMLLVLVFSVGLRLLPAGGFPGWSAGVGAGVQALLLPTLALAAPQAAILTRVLRSALLDTLGEEYMRTARAKGLSDSMALRRHALRNALIPVLSVVGLQTPFLLAGSIIVENVFALPGLGRLIFQAIGQRDLIVVQGVVMVMVFTVVAVTFLIDLAYAAVDPRIRRRAS